MNGSTAFLPSSTELLTSNSPRLYGELLRPFLDSYQLAPREPWPLPSLPCVNHKTKDAHHKDCAISAGSFDHCQSRQSLCDQ